ncbi:cobalt-precorrin-6A reductase [Streptomyces albidus (ex Kaewkla and Franco 2022)]|uniref:cobalt-precorrin-6A reductase n=1 Tax=Streptomyces albidus (ex Kaewkla and Franco 2022) TaxID=722709 RepID=UPI0015EECDB5|nr:cobalt-precorrin-6A reductase [Streptomyces albidus (ex Kaewkla and Franco 2022)]
MRIARHVLILGGTTEARLLAGLLLEGGDPALRVTTSLAGRVAAPGRLPGPVRTGGFGGAHGMARWLDEHGVDALIDATHPFAGTISFNAAQAASLAHVPLLALRRPGWTPGEGDDWHPVGSLSEAADALSSLGRRVFLTTGRTGLAAFAHLDALWFLVRSVDPPEGPRPADLEMLLDRGPFTLEGERELLRSRRIDVLVSKDSGGAATAPKLTAAREAGLPVVLVRRPPVPEGVTVAEDPGQAARWLYSRLGSGPDPRPDSRLG